MPRRDFGAGLCAFSRENVGLGPIASARLSSSDFRGYQRRLVKEAVRRPGIYLALDMGAGKTAIALKAMQLWRKHVGVRKALVVAPPKIIEDTWPDEFAKWAFARSLRYSMISGTRAQREAAATADADAYLVSRDNLKWLIEFFGKDRLPFDALVYDEASRLKSGRLRSARTKHASGRISGGRITAFARLAQVRKKFKRVVLMSGTPAPLGPQDWWGQMFILDHGKRLGKSREEFLGRWFNENPYTKRIVPKEGAAEEIMERIEDVVFYLRADDYVELPPLNIIDRWVDLDEKAMRLYRKFAREAWLEEQDVLARDAATMFGKLLQIANGSAYSTTGEPVRFHDGKIAMLKEIIDEAAPEPVLVFYSFRFDKEAILKAIPKARVLGETATASDWNAGKIPVMLAHPERGGYGLNLQAGGRHMVWFGVPTRLEWYLQANKRLHRSGQTKSVLVYRIFARNTVDERARALLEGKQMTQDDMLNAVRMEFGDG